MKILIAGERSGIIREAFRAKGHDCWSCDLLPSDKPGNHIQTNILNILNDGWDMMVAHSVCTRIANSGVLRLYKNGKKVHGFDNSKWLEMVDGCKYFLQLWYAPIEKKCIEAPILHGYAKFIIRDHQSQVIQPYEFGEDASKATCLWLQGLPQLKGTNYLQPTRYVDGKGRYANQCDSGQNKLGKNKAYERAKTYPGIAFAMAEQWNF